MNNGDTWDMGFQDANFIVIGATGGIGSELCRILSSKGGRLFLGGRDPEKMKALSNETGGEHRALDASNIAGVEEFVYAAAESMGEIHGIANCVGSLLLKPAHLTSEDEWNQTLSVNLGSAFATVRAAVQVMKPKGGSVVLVSTAAARTGIANHEAIAAAKAGVIGLTLSSAATYAKRNIRVNSVAPGLVETPLTERIVSNEASLKASRDMHALERIGRPRDIASMIAWLLCPSNSWVTGQVFGVDGGLSTLRPR